MSRRESIVKQVENRLNDMLRIGAKRHELKYNGGTDDIITSWGTYKTYRKACFAFVKWCKDNVDIISELGHKPHGLDECKPYINRWVGDMVSRNLSAKTISMRSSALVKLYGSTRENLGIEDIPRFHRADTKRSRYDAVRDKNFNTEIQHNNDLMTFCKCTGVRRAELEQIRGDMLIEKDGVYYLRITKNTKGGRPRVSEIVGSGEEISRVINMLREAGENKVFPKVNANADIHSYRAAYAMRIYKKYEREFSEYKIERMIVKNNREIIRYNSSDGYPDRVHFANYYTGYVDRKGLPKMVDGVRDVPSAYWCRYDKRGTVYDRAALFITSKNLGHNRENVVADNYLWSK